MLWVYDRFTSTVRGLTESDVYRRQNTSDSDVLSQSTRCKGYNPYSAWIGLRFTSVKLKHSNVGAGGISSHIYNIRVGVFWKR